MVVIAALVLLGGCGADRLPGSGGEASCASLLDFRGQSYSGHGELTRDPATTGRVGTGVMRGCDDGNGAAPDWDVKVAELADVPMSRAVLARGVLFVRNDRPLPEAARKWFGHRRCESKGRFELRGDWLGVRQSKTLRFDGDLRPPYRLTVHVNQGPPRYVGTTVQVVATRSTDPGLGPEDVRSSLWRGGSVTAAVRCRDGRFVAATVTSRPG